MDKVEFAWNAYAILERRDFESFLPIIHPDVEFRSLIAESEGRDYHGHEGLREWWASVADAMGGLHFVPTTIHEAGDGVCAELIVTGTVEGVEVSQRMWQAVRFKGEKVGSWRVVRSEAEAHAWLTGEGSDRDECG